MNILSIATSGEVTIRLIERQSCDFVILFDQPGLSAISYRTTDRAFAHKAFARSVELAEFGLRHPAWKTRRAIAINNTGD